MDVFRIHLEHLNTDHTLQYLASTLSTTPCIRLHYSILDTNKLDNTRLIHFQWFNSLT